MRKLTKEQQLMVDDGMPAEMMWSAEERLQHWVDNPPKAMPVFAAQPSQRSAADQAEIDRSKAERLARKAIEDDAKAKKRAALAKQNKERLPGSTWDPRKGRWVHPAIQAAEADETGHAFTLLILNRHPRAPGSRAAERFSQMLDYLAKKPSAKMAEIYANTTYTKTDFDWDLQRGSVKKEYTKT